VRLAGLQIAHREPEVLALAGGTVIPLSGVVLRPLPAFSVQLRIRRLVLVRGDLVFGLSAGESALVHHLGNDGVLVGRTSLHRVGELPTADLLSLPVDPYLQRRIASPIGPGGGHGERDVALVLRVTGSGAGLR